jgi:serine/threonine protein kinase
MMPSQPSSASSPHFMTRQQTVEYLDRTAEKEDSLHQKYIMPKNEQEEDVIGVGNFGAVLKATSRETGEPVAIKRLPKASTSQVAVQRELQALVEIHNAGGHPNLTALREHFDDPAHDSYYLVMDLVEGGELFDALCRLGPLTEADAARFLRQMASALQFLHALDLVHADLKPENCMLSQRDAETANVKLVDFGCCQRTTDTTTTTAGASGSPTRRWFGSESKTTLSRSTPTNERGSDRTAITPAYCPPEVLAQLRKALQEGGSTKPHITTAYDMWSLGVILFIMLVGAHPFDLEGRATEEEIASLILKARLLTHTPEWHNHIRDLSPDVQKLLKGLMHPDPTKRLTAADLLRSPWVLGHTATSRKISGSDSRISAYRQHQTKVAAQFFKSMLQHSYSRHNSEGGSAPKQQQKSLLEAAFASLDSGKGYISSKELHGDTSWLGADAKLNLPEAAEMLSQTHMKDHYFPAGHIIYREGDPGDVMYFIHSGALKAESKDGFVKDKRAGDFFGEDVLGDSQAYAFTARCITPVHAIQILRKDYNKYIAQDEDLALVMKEHGRLRRRERARVLVGMEKKTKTETYSQGDIIIKRGEAGNSLYVLLEGEIDISVNGHKVRSLRRGEMTGEHAAYYGHKPYNVTAQCMSDSCSVGVLAGKELRRVMAKNAALRESFHDIILRRDFKKALCAHLERPFPETEEEMKEAFDALIPENGPPELELETLRKMMISFDPSYTEGDIETMLKSMDLTGTNSLSWPEFKAIFTLDHEN